MWGYSFEDLARRAQEEASKLAVRFFASSCLLFLYRDVDLYSSYVINDE